MAAPYEQKQRFRPVRDDPFPARNEAGRQNHPHHGRTADGGKMYGNRLFDYECEAGGRIFIDQRVQLRHQSAGHQPLPRQCDDTARRDGVGIPCDYQQDSQV